MLHIRDLEKLHLFGKTNSFRFTDPPKYREDNLLCSDVIHAICRYLGKIRLILSKSMARTYLSDVGLLVKYNDLNNMLKYSKYVREIYISPLDTPIDKDILLNFDGATVLHFKCNHNDLIGMYMINDWVDRYIRKSDIINKFKWIRFRMVVDDISSLYSTVHIFGGWPNLDMILFYNIPHKFNFTLGEIYLSGYFDRELNNKSNDTVYLLYDDLKNYLPDLIDRKNLKKIKILLKYHSVDLFYINNVLLPALNKINIELEVMMIGDKERDIDYNPFIE